MPDPKDPKNDSPENKKDPAPEGGKPSPAAKPLVYDSWIDEQPEEVKTMLTGQTAGLKSALDSERENRKDLEASLRDEAAKAEGDRKIALEGMADDIKAADQKADFYESAHAAGVTNLKLAYHVAVTDEMFDRRGNVNFDTMKTGYPELFGGKPDNTKGGAGEGRNNSNVEPFDMNKLIRQKAGRL